MSAYSSCYCGEPHPKADPNMMPRSFASDDVHIEYMSRSSSPISGILDDPPVTDSRGRPILFVQTHLPGYTHDNPNDVLVAPYGFDPESGITHGLATVHNWDQSRTDVVATQTIRVHHPNSSTDTIPMMISPPESDYKGRIFFPSPVESNEYQYRYDSLDSTPPTNLQTPASPLSAYSNPDLHETEQDVTLGSAPPSPTQQAFKCRALTFEIPLTAAHSTSDDRYNALYEQHCELASRLPTLYSRRATIKQLADKTGNKLFEEMLEEVELNIDDTESEADRVFARMSSIRMVEGWRAKQMI
jgi:hypothetical protein